VIVRAGEEEKFLASQRLAVLPLDPDTHRRCCSSHQDAGRTRRAARGSRRVRSSAAPAGVCGGSRRARIGAGGRTDCARADRCRLTFFTPVGERDLLAHALDKLVDPPRSRDPRRSGWRVQVVRLRAELEHGPPGSWAATLKDPSATRERIAAPLKTQLERSRPPERWSGSSSSSPPSLRAPRSCSCSRAMRAPRHAPGAACAPERRPGDRTRIRRRCCITSSSATMSRAPRAALRVDRL